MLHLDIPNKQELLALACHRGAGCVSIFLPTTPVTPDTDRDRILLKNLAKEAIDGLERAGIQKREHAEVSEELDDLIDDDDFWRFQAHSLAIFATPEWVRTFRLPTQLEQGVHVADRFHLKPLLRATTFCHSGYVLALAEGSVRLIEVSADLPATEIRVEGMPKDVASAAGQSSIAGRGHRGRLVGSEGQKVRLRQYCRKIDAALRGPLSGCELPLVLASDEKLASIYRSVSSSANLATQRIKTSPERISAADLAAAARPILDDIDRERLSAWRALFAQREPESRTTTDIARAGRGATYGLVQTVLVDLDDRSTGTLDEASGAVHFSQGSGTYGLVDEIARRTLAAGGEVLCVRSEDIPHNAPLAAIFRYAF